MSLVKSIKVDKPVTLYISFDKPFPRKFEFKRNGYDLEFERYLNGNTPRIKFNVPNPGNYEANIPFNIHKIIPIELPKFDTLLPPYERNRVKDAIVIDNPSLDGTPARIDTMRGIIEKGNKFNSYSKPTRVFFLLHEFAHFYYKTEKFCDLFAMVHFLRMGYNMSTAMYCLTNVLRRTPENKERILYVYNKVIKAA